MQVPKVGNQESSILIGENFKEETLAKKLSENKVRFIASKDYPGDLHTEKGKLAYRKWKALNGRLTETPQLFNERLVRLERIATKAPRTGFEEGFKGFDINGNTYHASGPCMSDQHLRFIEKLTTFDLVVNLMEATNPLLAKAPFFYTNKDAFLNVFQLDDSSKELNAFVFSSQNTVLYQFKSWADGYEVHLEDIPKLLGLVKLVIEAQANGKSVLVHCKAAWSRTPLFISLCEIIRLKDFKNIPNDRIRFIMDDVLKKCARTEFSRFPNIFLITQFYSDEFIDRLKTLV